MPFEKCNEIGGAHYRFKFVVGDTEAIAFVVAYAGEMYLGLEEVVAVKYQGKIRYRLEKEIATALVKHVSSARYPISGWAVGGKFLYGGQFWYYTDERGVRVFDSGKEKENEE